MSVFFHTGRLRARDPHAPHFTIRLPVPTACTAELTEFAAAAFRSGHCYVSAGVMLNDLSDDRAVKGNLFDRVDRSRSERLMEVMDEVNDRLGQGAMRLAASGLDRRWAT
jgi:DNA polymerase V